MAKEPTRRVGREARRVAAVILAAALLGCPISLGGQEPLDPATLSHDDHDGADILGVFVDSLKPLLEHGSRVAFHDRTAANSVVPLGATIDSRCGCLINGRVRIPDG